MIIIALAILAQTLPPCGLPHECRATIDAARALAATTAADLATMQAPPTGTPRPSVTPLPTVTPSATATLAPTETQTVTPTVVATATMQAPAATPVQPANERAIGAGLLTVLALVSLGLLIWRLSR